jgi:hypothetical protein
LVILDLEYIVQGKWLQSSPAKYQSLFTLYEPSASRSKVAVQPLHSSLFAEELSYLISSHSDEAYTYVVNPFIRSLNISPFQLSFHTLFPPSELVRQLAPSFPNLDYDKHVDGAVAKNRAEPLHFHSTMAPIPFLTGSKPPGTAN